MKTYNLFLDDIRDPVICTTYHTKYMPQRKAIYTMEEWYVVRSYEEFTELLERKLKEGEWPKTISFDHDLAPEHYAPEEFWDTDWHLEQEFKEKTGNDCAIWLTQFCIDNDLTMPETWVHSMNPVGAERIQNSIGDWYRFNEKFKK